MPPNTEPAARFAAEALVRPQTGLLDATTSLHHFAIVSYAVDPAVLAALLPEGFEPEVRHLDDGRAVAFVSAVPFLDVDFRAHFAPFYKVRMGQTNYRAYVTHQGRRAVWFFGTTLSGFWIWVPRKLWRLPWHPAAIAIEASYADERCTDYEMTAVSEWGAAQLSMTGTNRAMGRLDGFADEEDTAVVLTHPLAGFYQRLDGSLGSYSVWHDRLELRHAEVSTARFEVFERLGLIDADTRPHSALVQQETEFTIFLPPTRVHTASP